MGKLLTGAAILFLLAGCASSSSTHINIPETVSLSESSLSKYASAKISGIDIIFSQMMIPHHSQALTLSELAFKYAEDDRVLNLAVEIYAAQAPEIELMETWLSNAENVPTAQDHSEMRGMLSEEELSELGKLRGKAFDISWLESMIEHHAGAVDMVNYQLVYSNTPEVIELGILIVDSQSQEIAEMETLLSELKG